MLQELFIKNFAIIDQAKIEFRSGLNVLTGETGAGKSLLVGALELILGQRARAEWIRADTDEALVEAIFEPNHRPEMNEILEDAGYPAEDTLLVKRMVNRSGKNRIYVNDRAATLGFLEGLGQQLVDIHGQHEHQSLLHVRNHREFLDLSGDLIPVQQEVAALYDNLKSLTNTLSGLTREHERMEAEKEFTLHQYEEISQADIRPGEEEELEQGRKKMLHVERLRQICQEVELRLNGDKESMLYSVDILQKRLYEAGELDRSLLPLNELLETAQHCLEEITQQVQQYAQSLDGDPLQLEKLEERLALLYNLKRKFNCSEEELLNLLAGLKEKIDRFDSFDFDQKKLQKEIKTAGDLLISRAKALSQARKKTAKALQKSVETELRAVGMKQIGFRVNIQPTFAEETEKDSEGLCLDGSQINAFGMDHIEFLIRPNPGQPYKPLQRIASGGELSRIMLALRNALRRTDKLPTLIFDEVDAGIGGAEAEAVGARLKALSQYFQVICITHLPQIAVFGNAHFKVSKQVEKGTTCFHVSELNLRAREQEIARMLGGAQITEKTIAHAREMLKSGTSKEQS